MGDVEDSVDRVTHDKQLLLTVLLPLLQRETVDTAHLCGQTDSLSYSSSWRPSLH